MATMKLRSRTLSARLIAASLALCVSGLSLNASPALANENDVIASIPTGGNPQGLALSPDGSRAYVADPTTNMLNIIDTSDNTVEMQISTGVVPNGVAASPDGTRVYVTNYSDSTVSVLDTSSKEMIATILVGTNPVGIAVSPDNSTVYTANANANSVSVIQTSDNSVVDTIEGSGWFDYPFFLAVSPDGSDLVVSNYLSDTVSLIATATNTLTQLITVGAGPTGLTFSPDGTKVYVPSYSTDSVSVIQTFDNTVTNTIAVGTGPQGVAISPDGALAYVINSVSATVSVISTARSMISATIAVGQNPQGIGVRADGARIYVASYASSRVDVLGGPGDTSTAIFAATPEPTITGTATVGETLTAETGTWLPTPDSFTFVWKRDGADISGATASTYVLQPADAGLPISVTATAVRSGFSSATTTSANSVQPRGILPHPHDTLVAMTCLDGGANGSSVDVTTGGGVGFETQALTDDCFVAGDYDVKTGSAFVINGFGPSLLQKMNPTTGALTTIGEPWVGDVSAVNPIYALAINSAGVAYAIDGNRDLFRLNLTTAELTLVGSTGLFDSYNYDFNPVDGLLYHLEPVTLEMVTINLETAAATHVGPVPSDYVDGFQIDSNGVAWYLFEGSLYSSSDLRALATREVYQGEITIDALTPVVYALIYVPTPTLPAPTDKLLAMVCSGTGANGGSLDVMTSAGTGLNSPRLSDDCFTGGDYDATTGITYVMNESFQVTLQTVDTTTGAIATIAPMWEGSPTHYVYVRAMAINANGAAYALGNSTNLYHLNLETGELTLIGNTGIAAYGFDFNSVDGLLYGVDFTGGELYTFDPVTATATDVGPFRGYLNAFRIDDNGVVWLLSGSTLSSAANVRDLAGTELMHGTITIDATTPQVYALLYAPLFVPRTFVTTAVPTISGTTTVGQTLTAVTGTWDPVPRRFTYVWKRGTTTIPNASASTYRLKAADLGHTITVTVTGVKAGYTSTAQTSVPSESVLAGPFDTAPLPTISGTMTAGQRLSVVPGTWSPSAAFTYVWKRDTAVILGATKNNYVLGAADVGKKITVEVSGSRTGFVTAARESLQTTAVIGAPFVTAPTPTLSGTVAVGQRLTAVVGTWSPAATLTYVWKRDTDVIAGATKSSYVLTVADRGKQITVIVSGAKAGYATTSKTSEQSAAVLGTAFISAPVPLITGTAKVGQKLGVDRGMWSPSASIAFVWRRNGEVVPGAINSTYRVTVADLGARITVTLTGSRSGYESTARESAETATVTQ
jgi:YVTN family beta-propeller protein